MEAAAAYAWVAVAVVVFWFAFQRFLDRA